MFMQNSFLKLTCHNMNVITVIEVYSCTNGSSSGTDECLKMQTGHYTVDCCCL